IFLAVVFTGCQRRAKSDEEKIISGETDVFCRFPTVFILCAIFGLTVYVNFTRLILTKATGADNKIILFFSGLIGAGGSAGIITGFASIITICVAVIFATKKGAMRVAEVAIFALDIAPEAMTAMEYTYTCGEISEETFMARKDILYKRLIFLGAVDGAGKFIAGNVTVMLFIMAAGIFGGIIIGTEFHGQTIQEAVETSIAFGISGGIIFLLPQLLLSAAMRIVSSCVYESIRHKENV
ncbi:MAG: FHIPEP family type III secretion protein, partial [Treponema sp.]|nr:FHIPEP family type III secretion protein [Treponema sp.]